jgi:hypothetical protein
VGFGVSICRARSPTAAQPPRPARASADARGGPPALPALRRLHDRAAGRGAAPPPGLPHLDRLRRARRRPRRRPRDEADHRVLRRVAHRQDAARVHDGGHLPDQRQDARQGLLHRHRGRLPPSPTPSLTRPAPPRPPLPRSASSTPRAASTPSACARSPSATASTPTRCSTTSSTRACVPPALLLRPLLEPRATALRSPLALAASLPAPLTPARLPRPGRAGVQLRAPDGAPRAARGQDGRGAVQAGHHGLDHGALPLRLHRARRARGAAAAPRPADAPPPQARGRVQRRERCVFAFQSQHSPPAPCHPRPRSPRQSKSPPA